MSLIPAQVYTRVLQVAGERGQRGAAFVSKIGDLDVLVTAKHLCSHEDAEQVTLVHPWTNSGRPVVVMLERVGSIDAPGDVAAFRLPGDTLTGLVGEVPLSSDGLVYTGEAFILGYPYGLSFDVSVNGAGLPYAKRGIISASRRGEEGEVIHVLDLIANPGFSGGPMVFFPPSTPQTPKFGGVVKANMLGIAVEPTEEEPNPPQVSVGLSYITDAGVVTHLIE